MSGRGRWGSEHRPTEQGWSTERDADRAARRDPGARARYPVAGTPTPKPAARDAVGVARSQSPVFGSTTPAPQPMAISALGLLLALGLPLLLTRWGRAWAQDTSATATLANETSTVPPTGPSSDGGLSQGAITAIIVVFSILGVLIVVVLLFLLVRKLQEKRQTEGTYRPSSEEQFSHAAEAQAPQDSKEPVRGCLPI